MRPVREASNLACKGFLAWAGNKFAASYCFLLCGSDELGVRLLSFRALSTTHRELALSFDGARCPIACTMDGVPGH